MATPSDALERILSVIDRMEIAYLIGGSVASSAHGIPRTTMDVDLVADLKAEQIEEFVEALHKEFYVDAGAVRDAIARQRSFNLIHMETIYKFDIFPLKHDAYSEAAFQRRKFLRIGSLGTPVECAVSSAEDTILRKLEWYRTRGKFERQWNDLRGVLRVSGASLDRAYMSKWAKVLKVDDLLEELLNEEPA